MRIHLFIKATVVILKDGNSSMEARQEKKQWIFSILTSKPQYPKLIRFFKAHFPGLNLHFFTKFTSPCISSRNAVTMLCFTSPNILPKNGVASSGGIHAYIVPLPLRPNNFLTRP
jgi:hypothetical protein